MIEILFSISYLTVGWQAVTGSDKILHLINSFDISAIRNYYFFGDTGTTWYCTEYWYCTVQSTVLYRVLYVNVNFNLQVKALQQIFYSVKYLRQSFNYSLKIPWVTKWQRIRFKWNFPKIVRVQQLFAGFQITLILQRKLRWRSDYPEGTTWATTSHT